MKISLWVCMPKNKQYDDHLKYMTLSNKKKNQIKSILRL